MASPLYPLLTRANLHAMELRESGDGSNPDAANVVWIHDTSRSPFFVAEAYHQFHSDSWMSEGMPYNESYVHGLWEVLIEAQLVQGLAAPRNGTGESERRCRSGRQVVKQPQVGFRSRWCTFHFEIRAHSARYGALHQNFLQPRAARRRRHGLASCTTPRRNRRRWWPTRRTRRANNKTARDGAAHQSCRCRHCRACVPPRDRASSASPIHGVDNDLVLNASRQFFFLPEEIKRTARSASGAVGGFPARLHTSRAERAPQRIYRGQGGLLLRQGARRGERCRIIGTLQL